MFKKIIAIVALFVVLKFTGAANNQVCRDTVNGEKNHCEFTSKNRNKCIGFSVKVKKTLKCTSNGGNGCHNLHDYCEGDVVDAFNKLCEQENGTIVTGVILDKNKTGVCDSFDKYVPYS